MRNFQKKGKWLRIMQSKFFLMFLGVLILVFSFSIFGFVNKTEETNKNRKILEDKITELEKSKEKLSADINQLKTDKGIEENIRDKFGLAKDGESMIMIVDDKNTPKTGDTGNVKNIFTVIKNWFK